MSDFVEGLWVLAIGLAVAAIATWRLRQSQAKSGTDGQQADLALEVEDLHRRRRDLYERLDSGSDLDPTSDDRKRLEHSAARVLRDLDTTERQLRNTGKNSASSAPRPEAPQPIVAPNRAGLVGFAFGAGIVTLVAVLFIWAGRDATLRPVEEPAVSASSAPDLQELSTEASDRIQRLQARLAQQPEDLEARKALAETLISEGLLLEGYRESERILEQSPEDADGLYLQGLVRIMMGQSQAAVELLDRALSQEPRHVNAFLIRGLARLRLEQSDLAIVDWERGLEAAGGSHGGLEHLLQMARQGKSAEEILAAPAGAPSAAAAATPSTGPPFRLQIDLAAGAPVPPGAVLFVSLRSEELEGPPAAVKRIDRPSFPIQLSLDDGDSMLGRPLPDQGLLSVRLDTDGDALTRDPGDLQAETTGRRGETVDLVLRP